MSNELTVVMDFTEIANLSQKLSRIRPAFEREVEVAMQRVMLPAERIAKQNAKVDTRRLRGGIYATVERIPGGARGELGNKVPHAATIEGGRRVGEKMPPKGVLIESGWLRRHPPKRPLDANGKPMRRRRMTAKQKENELKSREFVIRRAIKKRGMKGDHNLENTVKGLRETARAEFAAIGPRVVLRVVKGGR